MFRCLSRQALQQLLCSVECKSQLPQYFDSREIGSHHYIGLQDLVESVLWDLQRGRAAVAANARLKSPALQQNSNLPCITQRVEVGCWQNVAVALWRDRSPVDLVDLLHSVDEIGGWPSA